MPQFGFSRKKIGKLHKEYYIKRLEKAGDIDAFQKAIMATINALMDVMDANNKKITQDITDLLERKYPEIAADVLNAIEYPEYERDDSDDDATRYKDYYMRQELR